MPLARVPNKGQVVRPVKSIGQLYGVFQEHVRGRKRLGWEEERRRMEQTVAREVVNTNCAHSAPPRTT